MKLRVWLGSKLECRISDGLNTDRSIHSAMLKLMEPAPPG
jgi:hypothetical protein